MTFTNNRFATNIESYVDSACTEPLLIAPNPTSSGIFSLGPDVMTLDGVTAKEVDSKITRFNGAYFYVETYDLVYVDGDNMYFGECEAEMPEDRPMFLDFTRIFVKQ